MKKKLMMMVATLAVAFGAWAATETVGGYTWTYQINGGTAKIYGPYNYSSYTPAISPKPSGTVTIPSTLGGKPVTSIGDYAFYYCSGLTSVTIPDSVTSIGYGAFYGCSGLKSVTIGNGVTSIGGQAFYGCGLTSVTIPNSVTSIGYRAFSGCSGLTSVTIPDGVTSIGSGAFLECSGLTSVYISDLAKWCGILFQNNTANPLYYAHNLYLNDAKVTNLAIPDSVTSIGSYAFNGCSRLASVTIPDSLTSIGEKAFDGCSASIFDTTTIPGVKLVDGWTVGNTGSLSGDLNLTCIRGIGDYAFSGCSGLTSVTIGNSVTSIGNSAFYGCSGLTSVTIPNSVTSIGNSAFYGCSGLTSVTIPDSVTSIGWCAFEGCSGLTSVTIPDSVTSIGSSAFSGCSGLTNVTIPQYVCSSELSTTFPASYQSITNVVISDSVTSIGSSAFSGCSGLTSVTIPDSVTSIGSSAFYNCSGLASVTIPDSVTSIGSFAFSGCSGLTSITLPFVGARRGNTRTADSLFGYIFGTSSYSGGVKTKQNYSSGSYSYYIPAGLKTVVITDETTLGDGAFYNCSGLTSVTIPDSVTSIGEGAFNGCRRLTSVTIPDSVTSIGWYAFEGCSGLTSVTIPDSVTSIGNSAFYGCSGLTSVTIPDSVTNIADYAFAGCSGLTSVTIPDSVKSIGWYAFEGCSGLTSVTIPDSVKSIGSSAFSGCSGLTSVTIPDSVTSIGNSAFSGCSGLTSVTIPDSVTNIADYAFAGCTNLQTEVQGGYKVINGWVVGYTDEAEETIPDADSLKGICGGALMGCTALKRLEFGDRARLVSIGAEALKGCTELKTLVLPPSLTRIGNEAFMGCSYLDDVIVPGGVKSVGARAFKNCTGFTYAQIEHGVESIGEEAFCGCWRITEVDIPSSVSSIGQNAFGGDSSITKVALRGDIRQMSQIFANYQSIREATVKAGSGSLVDGLFSGCSSLETIRFLGDCPALVNNGANLYEDAKWSLVTYVSKDSTGWDGTAGSHTLPMAWPLVGSYRRSITYADDISAPHAVAFDANGGTQKTQNVEQRSETPFVLPKEPTRAGYTFAGWWTEKNGGVKVTEDTVFIEGVYSYLYAHWIKPGQIVLEGVFSGTGKVSLDENGNIVVVLTVDVSGTMEIPDNLGAVTIDLNGYVITGDDGPAIKIVKGDGEGAVATQGGGTTKLEIVDTSGGEKGRIAGGGENAGIEKDEDAASGVKFDVEEGVGVFNGDGTEQPWWELCPVEETLVVGEYFKATLAELGYDVPTDGTAYNVVAKGSPAGLKLVSNKAETKKVKQGGKTKTVVVKAAKSEWWIEGVPTAAVDFFTNPPYLVITANGETTTEALPVEVAAQEVVDLGELALEQSINTNGWLSGVGAGWTVSGLPTGLKYTPSVVYVNPKAKKKVVKYPAYSVYGKTTKAGLFTITAKKKKGAYYETMKYHVLVRPKAVDTEVFGEALTNIMTMAYVPVEWDLTNDVASVGGKVAKVAGLPTGLTFAAANTYAYKNAKKKTGKYLKQYGQTIIGTPTKTGTYVVTFTKNVTTGTGKNKKTVAKTAQILWTVVANDAELELGFNTAGGVVESGVVGLKYDGLMAFTATSNATVTASGMPAGVKLANLDNGQYAFTGFTTKAGTYLVTVKATLNGKTVTQRVALEVDGLPAWAKGTFNGYVTGDVQGSDADEQQLVPPGGISGLSTITVSAVGKVSGKFHELGTNWTFSAASYIGYDETAPAYTVPVTAKYPYKVPEKVKSGKKTVTKMVTKYVTRTMTLTIGTDVLGGVATLSETDGSAVVARQNRWGSTYKAVGTRLFTTKSGKKTLAYKTFTIKGTTEEGAAIGLMASETLSLKVTPNGAVAATLSFDTGKTKKDAKTKNTVKVIYKATCNTVVIPTSPADADPFTGEVYLYFAPSPANGFPGYVGVLPL